MSGYQSRISSFVNPIIYNNNTLSFDTTVNNLTNYYTKTTVNSNFQSLLTNGSSVILDTITVTSSLSGAAVSSLLSGYQQKLLIVPTPGTTIIDNNAVRNILTTDGQLTAGVYANLADLSDPKNNNIILGIDPNYTYTKSQADNKFMSIGNIGSNLVLSNLTVNSMLKTKLLSCKDNQSELGFSNDGFFIHITLHISLAYYHLMPLAVVLILTIHQLLLVQMLLD